MKYCCYLCERDGRSYSVRKTRRIYDDVACLCNACLTLHLFDDIFQFGFSSRKLLAAALALGVYSLLPKICDLVKQEPANYQP